MFAEAIAVLVHNDPAGKRALLNHLPISSIPRGTDPGVAVFSE
jgi:hypothetical protein